MTIRCIVCDKLREEGWRCCSAADMTTSVTATSGVTQLLPFYAYVSNTKYAELLQEQRAAIKRRMQLHTHEWKAYTGLIEQYEYCDCGEKRCDK